MPPDAQHHARHMVDTGSALGRHSMWGHLLLAGFHTCLQGQAPTSSLRVEIQPHPAGSAGQEILWLRPHPQAKTEKDCLAGSSDRGLHKQRTLGTSASTPPLLSRGLLNPPGPPGASPLLPRASLKSQVASLGRGGGA